VQILQCLFGAGVAAYRVAWELASRSPWKRWQEVCSSSGTWGWWRGSEMEEDAGRVEVVGGLSDGNRR
jgi:hypothetical protein